MGHPAGHGGFFPFCFLATTATCCLRSFFPPLLLFFSSSLSQQHQVGYEELSRWQLFEFPLLRLLRKGEVTENLLQFLVAFREPYLPKPAEQPSSSSGLLLLFKARSELPCCSAASVQRDGCVLWLALNLLRGLFR